MSVSKVRQFITATFLTGLKSRPFGQPGRRAVRAPGLLLAACGFAGSALAAPVELVFEDQRLPGTRLYLAIYDVAISERWDDEPRQQLLLTTDHHDPWSHVLELPPGQYAARAFLDTDGDGELKTTASGRPAEPFAISLGDQRKKPSVHFRHAIFTVTDTATRVTMPLLYPRGSDQPQSP